MSAKWMLLALYKVNLCLGQSSEGITIGSTNSLAVKWLIIRMIVTQGRSGRMIP